MDTTAVKVRDCVFTYGKGKHFEYVLNNVNLTVPSGATYALLGPSGCGKTTLLKIITGQLKANSLKEISVFGKEPNSPDSAIPGPGIGYMPQELALYEDLTTEETLRLFARLNLVKESRIEDKINKLIRVLELSLKKKLIRNLSGGQQRRVGLATALLHSPPLLILDEPTVGVDPLLRKQIWSHLVELTGAGKTTIIITTHYIEEAKDATIVGAMRMGRILVEASPRNITNTFRDNSLESCFYKICYADTSQSQSGEIEETMTSLRRTSASLIDDNELKPISLEGAKLAKGSSHFERVKHLTKRNLLLRSRNIPMVLFQLFIPVSSIVFYCLCLGRPLTYIDVALVNDELSRNYSRDFIDHLDTGTVSYKHYDLAGGIASVVSGENHAVLRVRENFTDCVLTRLIDGLDTDNDTVTCSFVSAQFDSTNQQIVYVLYSSFVQTTQSFYAKIYESLGKTPLLAKLPLDYSETILGDMKGGAAIYTIPGIIFLSLHFMTAGSTFIVVANDQRNGLEDKLRVSGVAWVDILASYVASEFVFIFAESIMLLAYVFYAYALPLRGSFFLVYLLTVLHSCVGLGLGFFLSAILPKESVTAGMILVFTLQMVHILSNGILWPLESMPIVFRKIANFFPMTLPIEAFKSIVYRGFGFENVTVVSGFVSSALWFAIYSGLSLIISKYRK